MLPTQQIYSIWPAVVPGNRSSLMTILPNEKAYLFHENAEYQITVIPMDSDEDYYTPHNRKIFTVAAQGGTLCFEHHFEGEQEHTILLSKGESTIATFSVYSLYEDLYRLRPLKGDLHSHSIRSDGKTDPAALAGHYREQGYDFLALTDHNRYYPGGEIDETYQGCNTGLTRVMGEEVHCPGSTVHIVHIGGKVSVAQRYVNDRDCYETELAGYFSKVPENIPEQYKERYAKAMWATDTIHAAGGLAIFPHPFWKPGASKAYNVCTELAKILLTSGMFDVYELQGGMEQPENNHSVALWAELRAEGLKIPVVGSSDVHKIENSLRFPHLFTLCFAEENSNDAIIAAVKSGNCVSVESVGADQTRQNRCYGSLRLVTYAQFLLKNYFPAYQRLTAGAGVAIRAYAMEDTVSSLISQHTALAENFSNRFFGKVQPSLPSEAMTAFEEKCRQVQLAGPKTRGSSVDATPAKSLI